MLPVPRARRLRRLTAADGTASDITTPVNESMTVIAQWTPNALRFGDIETQCRQQPSNRFEGITGAHRLGHRNRTFRRDLDAAGSAAKAGRRWHRKSRSPSGPADPALGVGAADLGRGARLIRIGSGLVGPVPGWSGSSGSSTASFHVIKNGPKPPSGTAKLTKPFSLVERQAHQFRRRSRR